MLLSHVLTLILGSYITKLLHVKIYKETQIRVRGVGSGQVGVCFHIRYATLHYGYLAVAAAPPPPFPQILDPPLIAPNVSKCRPIVLPYIVRFNSSSKDIVAYVGTNLLTSCLEVIYYSNKPKLDVYVNP